MKIACVYHSIDLDGWMSAAIVRKWFIDKHGKDHMEYQLFPEEGRLAAIYKGSVETLKFEYPEITFIGYNYGQPVPDLSGYDKVIMCDISFPKEEMNNLEFVLEYGNPESENFIWIDHHISAIKDNAERNFHGLRNTKFAACELTWKYFFPNETMPEIVRLLGRYDCFGHKGTEEEKTVLEFQYGARQCISNYQEAYTELLHSLHDYPIKSEIPIHENGKAIYQYLCTEAKQSYKNGFKVQFVEEITDHIGKNIVNRKFICINKERFNPINFGIDYHAEGYDGAACFHRRNDSKWLFSLYNDNDLVDCSLIAKSFGGGGHKGASGFIVDNIEQFLNKHTV